MRNARLDESQAGIKIAGRNINDSDNAAETTLITEIEELKNLLEQHRNMYTIKGETDHQPRLDA